MARLSPGRLLLALAGLAALAAVRRSRRASRSAPAFSDAARRSVPRDVPAPVRPSGPEAMRDPPARWDRTDEASDESFPASDPSARY